MIVTLRMNGHCWVILLSNAESVLQHVIRQCARWVEFECQWSMLSSIAVNQPAVTMPCKHKSQWCATSQFSIRLQYQLSILSIAILLKLGNLSNLNDWIDRLFCCLPTTSLEKNSLRVYKEVTYGEVDGWRGTDIGKGFTKVWTQQSRLSICGSGSW